MLHVASQLAHHPVVPDSRRVVPGAHLRIELIVACGDCRPRSVVETRGARQIGYRATLLEGIRDPRLIRNLDDFLSRYRDLVARLANSVAIASDSYQLTFRAYGHNAVMGSREPCLGKPGHKVGLLVDVVATTEEHASALLQRASSAGTKLEPVRGIPAGGNFAAPFSPNFVKIGPVFEWSVWHRMKVGYEREPCRVEFVDS
jgi:hypothetical protein